MKNTRETTPIPPNECTAQLNIRIPPSLKLYIQGRAKRNYRSFNSEAVVIFKAAKEKEEDEQQQ